MNVGKKSMKYRALAQMLATSICLMSVASCGGVSTPSANSDATGQQTEEQIAETDTTDQPALEQQADEVPSYEATKSGLDEAYLAYIESVDESLLKPLEVIANEPEANDALLQSPNLDPGAVEDALNALENTLEEYSNVNSTEQNEEEIEEGSPAAALRESKSSIAEVQTSIINPLLVIKEKYAVLNGGLDDNAQATVTEAVRTIQTGISSSDEAESSDSEPTSDANPTVIGQYGNETFNLINDFVGQRNIEIDGHIEILKTVSSAEQPPASTDKTGLNWLSIVALLLGLANTAALGLLIYLFRAKSKAERAAAEEKSRMEKNQTASVADNRYQKRVESDIQQLRRDVNKLRKEYNKTLATASHQPAQNHRKTESYEPAPAIEYRGLQEAHSTQMATPVSASFAGNRAQASPPPSIQHQAPPRQLTSADAYNQNPALFQRVATVALSQSSQEELRVGKSVTPTFSESSQGDYWVVTQKSQKFYIVVKDRAILNKNNLETLQIIYDFENQPNLTSLRRHYGRLAEVAAHNGTDWMLKHPGSLAFH